MKRKYQVFISSTFSGLKDERHQAMLGILAAGHLPLALEYHGVEAFPRIGVIKEAIAECQFYVLILGHRYGSVGEGQPTGEEKSYVELELNFAQENHLRILAFVMPRDRAQTLRNQLARPDDLNEVKNEQKFWNLYDRLTLDINEIYHKPFSSPDHIYTELYAYFNREHSDVKGYIPEPVDEEDTNILRISSGNQILREAIQRLGQFKFVDPRLSISPEKKEALGKAFLQLHGDHIQEKWQKVFIESGSTLTYVAKELCQKLPTMREGKTNRKVITNNSLAYLYLWLCSGVLCHPEPDGPPDDKYGGMYGALTERDRFPDYANPALDIYDPDAVGIIKQMSRSIFGDPEENKHSILLAAASALQLSDAVDARKVDPKKPDDISIPETDEDVLAKLKLCRGFHGGSYQNRLFKRAMFLSKIPAFIFIHDEKIDYPIRVGVCHFLCDNGYSWDDFLGSYPLSIWVACERETVGSVRDQMRTYLNAGDWTVETYGDSSITPIVLTYNAAFLKSCRDNGIRLHKEV